MWIGDDFDLVRIDKGLIRLKEMKGRVILILMVN